MDFKNSKFLISTLIAVGSFAACLFLYSYLVSNAVTTYPPAALLQPNDITERMIRTGAIIDGKIATGTQVSLHKIGKGGDGPVPFFRDNQLHASNTFLYFDWQGGALFIASSTPSRAATTSGSIYTSGTIEAANLVATNTIKLRTVTYTPPSADGTSGQFLQTNGAGVLSFQSVSSAYSMNIGQTLLAGDPVAFATSTAEPINISQNTDDDVYNVGHTAGVKIGQEIVASSSKLIAAIDLKLLKSGTPDGDLLIELRPNSGTVPHASIAFASSTIKQTDVTVSATVIRANFFPAVYIPDGEDFWITVSTKGTLSGVNFYQVRRKEPGNPYLPGDSANDTGAGFVANTTSDIFFTVYDVGVKEGSGYLSHAALAWSASTTIGMLNNNTSTNTPGNVITDGVITGLSGLTPGRAVYLTNTLRGLSHVSGIFTKVLGLAASSTAVLLDIRKY